MKIENIKKNDSMNTTEIFKNVGLNKNVIKNIN